MSAPQTPSSPMLPYDALQALPEALLADCRWVWLWPSHALVRACAYLHLVMDKGRCRHPAYVGPHLEWLFRPTAFDLPLLRAHCPTVRSFIVAEIV